MWALIQSVLWWLFVALLIFSLIIFIGFYLRGAFRDRLKYQVKHAPHPEEESFALTLASITNSFITKGIVTDFWNEAGAIQESRLNAISQAQQTIDFETFFMTPGKRADDFAAAITERASAGVKVRLVVDSYGTKDISKQYWERLKRSGIAISFFNSFNWKAPLDYAGRTHRKLLIIDSKFALVGGAGISDLWDGTEKDDDTQPWLDVEMRLEGEIVSILEGVFSQHWTFGNGVADLSREKLDNSKSDRENHLMLVIPGANPKIQFSPIRAFKYNSIIAARKRIWLASPYFLPDNNSIDLLIAAKQNGLDVRILTTSKRSDKKPVYYASYEHYGRLLKGDVQIHEYQPSMTHAKLLLIDDRWATTGSANFDPRSFCHNDELDICSAQPELVKGIKSTFEKGFAQSKLVTYTDWKQRSLIKHRILGNIVDFFQWQL
ncbi:phosphatidylserine/phosphatidylglycerophosphate/cardiolipin synthase family protein [Pleurocapsa sp. PCC 7319]|uniref:phospholipase D-like domain-containing protein n=1 Tax=Pleurocapsa sp. PCC 7319 TaxID=118161 RepID=UPI00034822AC|nr:phospholipase D-like domain-containing protein [Pleurocapsa sp. PCC 7319]